MSDQVGKQLNLLLFSVGGVRFAIDADQVTGMTPYAGEEADDLFWFHEELDYGRGTPAYDDPVIIAIRTEDATSYRVVIDRMEDVAEICALGIRPLPPLLEPLLLRKGMWGVAERGGQMVLLVDFQRLLRYKGRCIEFNGGYKIC